MSSGTNLENIIASQLATLAELHKQEQSAVANLQTLQMVLRLCISTHLGADLACVNFRK